MIILVVYSLATMEPETYRDRLFPTDAYGNITNNFTVFIRIL
jgi:hypothetical protein